jgi:HK97 family phage portal protein
VSLLRQFFGTEHRDFSGQWGPYNDGRIPPPGYDGDGLSNVVVNETTALALIDVYACVSLWADSVSMLPIDQFRNKGDWREKVQPQSPIITQPDPELERWDWTSRMVTSLAVRGNAYSAHLSFSDDGYPTATRAIHPDDITKFRDRKTDNKIRYRLRSGDILESWQVMHIPLVTQPGSLVGLSPIECGRRGIRMAVSTEKFGDQWFDEGAIPSSLLETDQQMDDNQARRQQARWMARHRNRRTPAVLSGGLKWKPITVAPNESQFIESRKLNTAQIARLWRIAPHLIGDVERSTSWGSGIEEQGIGFVVFTLGPVLTRLEAALNRVTPRGQYVKFNVSALLRGNSKDRYAAYAVGRQWGWLSVNDIRALEDLPPVDGGDVYLQPLNMIEASEALQVLLGTKGAPA